MILFVFKFYLLVFNCTPIYECIDCLTHFLQICMYYYHLGESSREMVAIVVHEVVAIPSEFLAQFAYYSFDVVFREVRVPNLYTLPIRNLAVFMAKYKGQRKKQKTKNNG